MTNKMREVDVLMTRGEGRHKVVTAIECKDWKKPVDDTVVEGFAKKCSSLHVNKAIIVSTRGFTPEALVDAAHEGISCLSLSDVASFSWVHPEAEFVQYERRWHYRWSFDMGEANAVVGTAIAVEDLNGNSVPLEVLNAQAVKALSQLTPPWPPEENAQPIDFEFSKIDGIRVRHVGTESVYPILRAKVHVEIEMVEVQRAPFNLHEYVDHQNQEKFEFAQNELVLGGRKARLMLVPEGKDQRAVKLVFDPVKES